MPKNVDHALRRRQITDAVCRITITGGLSAATFREVAAEAGVSVRLVQYYFGSKDELLLATQRHVAERSIERLRAWTAATDGSPRAWLRAFLTSFIPIDEESRVAMLMYVALHTESLVDPTVARVEALAVPRMMQATIAGQLGRGRLVKGAEPEMEAAILTALLPGICQSVLDGMVTEAQAFAVLDYALDRVFR
jgi:TetR/AcrR family transcriptional repressor of bet genes